MEHRLSIEQLQTKYYEDNKKNTLFKNSQKTKCAEYLTSQLDINVLLEKTSFIIPGTPIVFLDYLVFKTYAHPTIYDQISQYIVNLLTLCIQTHRTFEVHINLKSFTISAAQRYVDIIKRFCSMCLQSDTQYAANINKLVIYNAPSMIDAISKMFRPFINERVRDRIELVNAEKSAEILKNITGGSDV
jgi:hypothetical protein